MTVTLLANRSSHSDKLLRCFAQIVLDRQRRVYRRRSNMVVLAATEDEHCEAASDAA